MSKSSLGRRWVRAGTVLVAVLVMAAAVPAASAEVSDEGRTTVSQQGRTFYVDRSASTNLDDVVVDVAWHTVSCLLAPCAPIVVYPQAAASASVWEETNGCDGLQRDASDCDGDNTFEDPDERVVGVGI